MMQLRQATMNDSKDLLAWRNDPLTRLMFRNQDEVKQGDHDNWMRYNVEYGYPAHLVMIGEVDGAKVGVVRFDATDDVLRYDTSVIVAPDHRGHGYGAVMLGMACELMGGYTLDTEVRPSNAASQRMFQSCGFEKISERPEFYLMRRPAK